MAGLFHLDTLLTDKKSPASGGLGAVVLAADAVPFVQFHAAGLHLPHGLHHQAPLCPGKSLSLAASSRPLVQQVGSPRCSPGVAAVCCPGTVQVPRGLARQPFIYSAGGVTNCLANCSPLSSQLTCRAHRAPPHQP